jgi:DNA-binding NarL/FixJ family response regulator
MHSLATLGLEQLIGSARGFTLSTRPAASAIVTTDPPADVVVYIGEPVADTAPVTELAALSPVLVIAEAATLTEVDRYLKAGALGYLHSSAPLSAVLDAVKRVAQRRRIIYLPHTTESGEEPGDGQPLSSRERQVLEHIALGRTHDQTARSLGLSRHTVDTYVKRARRKLSAGNKADLVRAAMAF